jgi:DNA-binding LacI/PurR family transcriptional regulator
VRVTLKDVAEKAGVSLSTASRALAGRAGVSEEVRQRILKIAGELNYRPDELARGLARASSNIIGGLILEFANPFYVPVIEAIEAVADEHDYVAVISETRRQLSIETRLVERLRRLRVAGCVITPVLESLEHLFALRAEGIPVVAVGRRCRELDYVCADDMAGAVLLGRHLLGLGHRRVAYIFSGEPFNEPEQIRWQGFRKTFQEAGIPCDESCCIQVGNSRVEGGLLAAERVLALSPRPTAVFAATDRLAVGLIYRFRQRGVQVPGDIAVVGYDDIPITEYLEVPLTTVSYPKYEMGRLAAQMLFERIEGRGVRRIEHVLLQPELIVRQSCGAVSANEGQRRADGSFK